jgi:hypothetical protein
VGARPCTRAICILARYDSTSLVASPLMQVIQPPHGQVFLAAKSYYFGVGGSVAGFKTLLNECSPLECQHCEAVEGDTSVKREVLQLGFPVCITPYFL